ncbi:MAG TPA: histidine phosphatase family protein [Bryobacteraceae bacterium]|nr:histidine phosphatase family protein [Bryobacteraceae bacterium]
MVYLVRHGQAGTRENYDSLSELGHRQARRLGEHFADQGIEFDAVYSGTLARQRATALAAISDADAIVDPGWNEFDLAQVYSEYAPQMAADDAEFRRDYEEMQLAMVASRGAHDAPIHRRWNDCDKKVVRAWVESRYEYSGETWPVFVARVHGALDRLTAAGHEGNVIVFTSATPIGVCAARTLEMDDGRAMWLAGVLMNGSFTTLRISRMPTLRVQGVELRLFSFNNSPHLDDPELRTFR